MRSVWSAPVIATYTGLGDDAERVTALDRDLLEFATRETATWSAGPVGPP